MLYLSLLPVALPWLRWEQRRIVGIWLICPLLIGVICAGDRRLRASLIDAARPTSAAAAGLAALLIGLAMAALVHEEPFYGPGAWVAVAHGLILAATAMTVTAFLGGGGRTIGDLVAPAACGAGLTALVVLPLVVAPAEMGGLLDTLRSGSAERVIAGGYRPLFDAIDANPLVILPEARNTNLRHEPALVLALAMAPVGAARRTNLGRLARAGAAAALLLTLSRSAIGAGLLVAGIAGIVSVGDGNRSRQGLTPILASLGALAVLISPLGASLGDRFQSDDRSTVVRSEALYASVDLLGQQPFGTSVTDLPAGFVRPHLFLLDAYLGIGVIGLAVAVVVFGLLANQVLIPLHRLRFRSGVPLTGLVLALGIVALTRYATGGSFLHATIAWYGMGAMIGWRTVSSIGSEPRADRAPGPNPDEPVPGSPVPGRVATPLPGAR